MITQTDAVSSHLTNKPLRQKICLCTIGTRGDILPFVLISQALIARGQSVTVLSNANWRELFESKGTEFIDIAPKDPPQSARDDLDFFNSAVLPSFHKTFDAVATLRESNANLSLVYRSGMAGARVAAEVFELPSMNVMLQPMQMKSKDRPPWPLTRLAQNHLAWLNKKTLIPALYALGELRSPYRKIVNAFRVQSGLPKAPLFKGQTFPETHTILLCPDWFAMPQADWGTQIACLGFPFGDNQIMQDSEVEHFIQTQQDLPIVFTPGTGVNDISDLFATAQALCEDLERPGLFLSPSAEKMPNMSERLITRNYVPLESVLSKACLLVHHGGIGTTAQAIRAGIPQIISPNRFDQPDNALRIAELGLGAGIFKKQLSRTGWATLAERVLSSEKIRTQTANASKNLQGARAVDDAADLILSLFEET